MSQILKPHELMSMEEYWEDEQTRKPRAPIAEAVVDGFSGARQFAAYGAAKVIKLYSEASTRGHIAESISPGRELPIVPRGEGLVRIVEDLRLLNPRPSLIGILLNRRNDDTEAFDELAQTMAAERFYTGDIASVTLGSEGVEPGMRLWRIVSYLTASKSGAQLEGLHSHNLTERPQNITHTYTIPPLVVGKTYSRNRKKTAMSRIVTAEIIVPGTGSPGRAKRRPQPKSLLRPVFTT